MENISCWYEFDNPICILTLLRQPPTHYDLVMFQDLSIVVTTVSILVLDAESYSNGATQTCLHFRDMEAKRAKIPVICMILIGQILDERQFCTFMETKTERRNSPNRTKKERQVRRRNRR